MKICITGKPHSGKSLALSYIKNMGYKTWAADEYVHYIYKYPRLGYQTILKIFGKNYVNKKEVDRKKLGKLVFTNKKALQKLNFYLNKIIKKAIISLNDKKTWFIELGTYIYYPKDFANIFDKTIYLFCNKKKQEMGINKKFSYLKKIPTFFVDKSKNNKSSILYIGPKYCQLPKINVDIFINNQFSKKILKKNIEKILKNLSNL